MTALFEMRIRIGGDPRGFGEFTALREALAKLNHPACPEVDWPRVEQLCLTLFELNGADLQTACAYALARGQRYGLTGMVQGLAVLELLVGEWSRVWPPRVSTRLETLAWLFTQWQPLLRALAPERVSAPMLVHLDCALERLHEQLVRQSHAPQPTLHALRQQVAGLLQRLQRNSPAPDHLPVSVRLPEPAFAPPIVILSVPPLPPVPKRRSALWLSIAAVTLVVTASVWLASLYYQEVRRLEGLLRVPTVPTPVMLDGLFDAGSSELKPEATKVLVKALVDIKARPDWLIVITGHTDATGDTAQNQSLSQDRAFAVRDWMQRMGDIPESCFAVQGYAAHQPIAGNDTETGRTANRRVDLRLVPQAGACGGHTPDHLQ